MHGLENENTASVSADAIWLLLFNKKSDLFAEKHLDALILVCLSNEAIRPQGCQNLRLLAEVRPDLVNLRLSDLIIGLGNPDSEAVCAEALGVLVAANKQFAKRGLEALRRGLERQEGAAPYARAFIFLAMENQTVFTRADVDFFVRALATPQLGNLAGEVLCFLPSDKTSPLFAPHHVEALTQQLTNTDTDIVYSAAWTLKGLSNLDQSVVQSLFNTIHVDALIKGIGGGNPDAVRDCVTALRSLAGRVPNLFTADHVTVLLDALFNNPNPFVKTTCFVTMTALAREHPQLFKESIDPLLTGLNRTDKYTDDEIWGYSNLSIASTCRVILVLLAFNGPGIFTFEQINRLTLSEDKSGPVDKGIPFKLDVLSVLSGSRPQAFREDTLTRVIGHSRKNKDLAGPCYQLVNQLVSTRPELFAEAHISELISWLETPPFEATVAGTLSLLAEKIPFLFSEAHVHGLLRGLWETDLYGGCHKAIELLTVKNPDLVNHAHSVLLDQLHKAGSYELFSLPTAMALGPLAKIEPALFNENHIRGLLYSINSYHNANECLWALRFLIEKRSDLRAVLAAQYDSLGERIQGYLSHFNITPLHLKNAERLKEKFNIDYFTRYPADIVQDMLSEKRDETRPLAYVSYPKSDYNNAFYYEKITELYNAGYQVVVFESGTEDEFIEMAAKIKKAWGTAQLLIVGGHGTPQALEVGASRTEENLLDITDDNVMRAMKELLNPAGAQIILRACSTGDPKTKNNLAATVSGATGCEVFAPNKPTSIAHLEFKHNDAGRLIGIGSVEWYDPETSTVYNGGVLRVSYVD
ncbi:MAG: DUF4347 domain-containing protein [Deltaproteobacteria bacterium]|nr:DUF4347 domain-containing protein [Deltaproteobacteria bacterium]